jgi:hypothetical protein
LESTPFWTSASGPDPSATRLAPGHPLWEPIVGFFFLDAPLEDLSERLKHREEDLPAEVFSVREARLREWWEMFEPPNDEEMTIL